MRKPKPYASWSIAAKKKQVERSQAFQNAQVKKGLCTHCNEHSAERIIAQDGKVMHQKRLRYCFKHLKIHADASARWIKTNKSKKGTCAICHSNPAELCSICIEKGK